MTTSPSTALALRDPWSLVPSLGNLDAYVSAVNRMPMLSHDEELDFARRLRDQGDLQAAGRLVLSHLRLVVSISRQYLGYGLPQGDLILLDMQLPDISGIELLRHLKRDELLAEIPVVVVSADASPQHIEQALTLGAAHYVTKPLDVAHFLAIVDELLGGLETRWGV